MCKYDDRQIACSYRFICEGLLYAMSFFLYNFAVRLMVVLISTSAYYQISTSIYVLCSFQNLILPAHALYLDYGLLTICLVYQIRKTPENVPNSDGCSVVCVRQ